MALSSRQKPRFLTAATEPMSAKVPQATFAQALSSRQKPRFFDGGNGADVRESAAGDFCSLTRGQA
jgi:hypothetical protein